MEEVVAAAVVEVVRDVVGGGRAPSVSRRETTISNFYVRVATLAITTC